MNHDTCAREASPPSDITWILDERPEPWRRVIFDDLIAAFAAVRAAQRLGMSWQLSPTWCEGEIDEEPRWILELGFESVLPETAHAEFLLDGV